MAKKNYSKDKKNYKKDWKKDRKDDQNNGSPDGNRDDKGSRSTNNPGGRDNFRFNSPDWYNHNPDLLHAISNVSFNAKLGFDYSITPDANNFVANIDRPTELYTGAKINAPSVMAIYYANSIGVSKNGKSAVNVAAQAIQSFMRSKATIRNTYEKTDLMMYLLAMDSVYSALFFARKILRCARVFSIKNRDIGSAWITAMGIDVNDLRKNHKTYVSQLNMLMAKTAQMCVPSGYPMFERHMYMTQNIFRDVPDDISMAQTYLFVPNGFYKWNNKSEGGTSLDFVPWFDPRNGFVTDSFEELLDMIDGMLDIIVSDSVVADMSGDIRNTFGLENCYVLTYLDENDAIVPIYDSGLQAQIENARSVPLTLDSLQITQTADDDYNSIIVSTPQIVLSEDNSMYDKKVAALCATKPYLNMHWENVQPMDVMYSTRLTPAVGSVEIVFNTEDPSMNLLDRIAGLSVELEACGSEIITSFAIYSDSKWNPPFQSNDVINDISGLDSIFFALNSFDWHPAINIWDASSGAFRSTYCDLDNFAPIPDGYLTAFHDLALMSLWKVPSYGISNVSKFK